MNNYLMILLLVCVAVIAQTLLKLGMKKVGKIQKLQVKDVPVLIIKMFTNPFVLVGVGLYGVGSFIWLILLSRLDLSFLYPFGALEYILIFLASRFILHEKVKRARIFGVVFILIGIFILTKYG